MMLRKIILALGFLLIATPAMAQWQVPSHTVPIGRGGGVTGFLNTGTGSAHQVLTSNGASADPTWQPEGSTGTVTSITAGTGLAGGTITTTGTISLDVPVTVPHGGTGSITLGSGLPLFGAGTSPITTGTLSGNTTKLATSAGTLTSGDCVSLDASSNYVDAGGNCGVPKLTGDLDLYVRTAPVTVTISIASPGVVSWTGHGLSINSPVVFNTTGALPTGLTAGTIYYVISAGFGVDAFEVSTSLGGSAVDTSGTQSGVQSAQTGDDAHDCSAATVAKACLTIQRTVTIAQGYQFNGHSVNSNVADGLYIEDVSVVGLQGQVEPTGTAAVFNIIGDTGSPSSVVVQGSSISITAGHSAAISVDGIRVLGGFYGLVAADHGSIQVNHVDFGTVSGFQAAATTFGQLTFFTDYSISGAALSHWASSMTGSIDASSVGTITISGTPAFGLGFAYASLNGNISTGSGITFTGSATGSRYAASLDGAISTRNAGITYLPGDAPGTLESGGQYDDTGPAGTVTNTGTLTANAVILGNGGADVTALGSLGTTTTVLHGNAAGPPTFGAVANADLVNPSTTVNGQTCTLGSTCTVTAAAAAVTVGSTTVGSGTTTRVLFDNSGVLGEYTLTGSAGSVVMSSGPTIASPTFSGTVAGANTIPLSILAQSGANTMLGNWTGSTANVAANAMPSCADTGTNHLNYVSGTGIICGTSGTTGTVTSIATTSPITGGTITTTGTIACATCTTNASALTSNAVVLGGGSQATKVVAGIITDGTSKVTLGIAGSSVGGVVFNNATSGTITIAPVAGALSSGTLSLPNATDTLVGKATTDMFTNKTYDTAGTGNSFSINGVAVTANTGTGAVARGSSPSFTTPAIDAATGTSVVLTGSSVGFTPLQGISTEAAAAAGPILDLYRNSVSPAANDIIGEVDFNGQNSTPAKKTYASMNTRIDDATASSEDASLFLATMKAGTVTNYLTPGANAAGTATANSVGLPLGQLSFPASQNASSDANTLDDYKEGTWTPVIAFGGGTTGVTYTTQSGIYTKIGRAVIANATIILSSKGSSVGNAQVQGLPFTVLSPGAVSTVGAVTMTGLTVGGLFGQTNGGGTNVNLFQNLTTGASAVTDANFTNTTTIFIYVVYSV